MKKTEKEPKQHTIVQDETYQHMYRIVYPDGVLSEDMYSKAWAEEYVRILNLPKEEAKVEDDKSKDERNSKGE